MKIKSNVLVDIVILKIGIRENEVVNSNQSYNCFSFKKTVDQVVLKNNYED